jgi:TRAP-type transport system periplasmic protein
MVKGLSGARQSALQGEVFDKTAKAALDEVVKRGGKVYTLSDPERAAFMAKTKPIIDAWIANAEKRGLPGRKLYEDVIALVDKYAKEEASGGAGKK